MIVDEIAGGSVETDEPMHTHYCDGCRSLWGHADESCVAGRGVRGNEYSCPICMEEAEAW